jgi:hypothetical protein
LSQAFDQAVQIVVAVEFNFNPARLASLFDDNFGAKMP